MTAPFNADFVAHTVTGTPGTGPFTCGAAPTTGPYQTLTTAGCTTGAKGYVTAKEGTTKAQTFLGTLTLSGSTWSVSRDQTFYSTAGGTSDETFTSAAILKITPLADQMTAAQMSVGDIYFSTQARSAKDKLCNGASYLQSSYPDGYAANGLIADLGPQVNRSGLITAINTYVPSVNFNVVKFANSLFVAVGASGTIITSTDGQAWANRTNALVTTANLVGLIYANSLWVAWGTSGTIITSSDAITWTTRTSGVLVQINKIVYMNSVFVACTVAGGGAVGIITSTNGTTWTLNTSVAMQNLTDVAYGNGQWCAVAWNGSIYTATDPTSTWTSRSAPFAANNQASVYYESGLSLWVWASASSTTTYIYTATDVTSTWTSRLSSTTGGNGLITGIVFANSQLVVTGNGTAWFYSTNATSWTAATVTTGGIVGGTGSTGIANPGPSFIYAASTFVALRSTGLTTASDPSSTITNTSVTWIGTMAGIAYGASIWVAVGSSGTLWYSSNLTSWTNNTKNASVSCNWISYGNGYWMVVGAAGVIYKSSDLSSWAQVGLGSVNSTALNAVFYGNGKWVSVGNSGTILTSSDDGATWVAQTSGTSQNLNNVIYANSIWVVVGAGGTILTATDPTSTWTNRPSGSTNALSAIAYGASTWAVGGTSNTLLTATDPTSTWTARATGLVGNASIPANGLAFGNGVFVINVSTSLYTSADAITWSVPAGSSMAGIGQGVVFGSAVFLAGGIGATLHATTVDGTKIVPKSLISPGSGMNSKSFGNGMFAAVDTAGNCFTIAEYSYSTSDHFAVPNIGHIGPSDAPINAYQKLAA